MSINKFRAEADAKRLRRVTPTWYAAGEHFGMDIFEDQRMDSPDFDWESPIRWEAIDEQE